MSPIGENHIAILGCRTNINYDEISFAYTTSSGPGGQNVNKVSTRATLNFNVKTSLSLSTDQKIRVLSKLRTRINAEGVMRVVSSKHRTQIANRRAAIERFSELLATALVVQKKRKPTNVPNSVKRKRLDDKAHRAKVKQNRRSVSRGD